MFFILSLVVMAAISLATVVVALRRAPEAYEDEQGFHVIETRSRPLQVSRSDAFSATRASSRSRYGKIVKAFLPIGRATELPRRKLSAKA